MTYTAPWRRDRVSSLLKVEREGTTEEFNAWSDDGSLWDEADSDPALDLFFAARKDLKDQVSGNDLITFTRASDATVIGSDGLIQDALNRTNFLPYSSTLTGWNEARTSLSAASEVTPDGSVGGVFVEETTDTNTHVVFEDIVGMGAERCFSIYLKPAGRTRARVQLGTLVTGENSEVSVLLSGEGSVTAFGGGAIEEYGIEQAENGWWRVWVSGTGITTSSTARVHVYIRNDADALSYTGETGKGLYFWGAQAENRTLPTDLIQTNGAAVSVATPRFQHDPITGECQGLRVEEARTNLVPFSGDIPSLAATIGGDPLYAETATANPFGVAENVWLPAVAGGRESNTVVGVNTSSYCVSVFVRRPSGYTNKYSHSVFCGFGVAGNGLPAEVMLDFDAESVVVRSGSPVASGVERFTGGWYRIWVVQTNDGSGTSSRTLRAYVYSNGVSSGTDINSRGGEVFGLQAEVGAFPTSYIPTEGSQVTRAAELPLITGANFSSWYDLDGGTVFFDGQSIPGAATVRLCFGISDGTLSNRLAAFFNSNSFQTRIRVSGAGTDPAAIIIDTDLPHQFAYAFAVGSLRSAIDGTLSGLVTPASLPTVVDRLSIGCQDNNVSHFNGNIKRLTYWPPRLLDATLQAITS